MSNIIKAGLVAIVLATGVSSAMAAPQADRWFEFVHRDNNNVPAKQFFNETQRDGN